MKYRLTKKELKECITEAVKRAINEDKFDDELASALANDPKAGKAASVAGGEMGVDLGSRSATGKKGRPNKKAMAAADANALKAMSNDANILSAASNDETPEDDNSIEDVEDAAGEEDEKNVKSFDMDFANMGYIDLVKAKKSNPQGSAIYRKAASELLRRKNILLDYKEGIKPEWGYVIDPETGLVEPDPKHKDLGSKNDSAWNANGTDTGYMNFSTAGKGNWFSK